MVVYLVVRDLTGNIADHEPALELVQGRGQVAAPHPDLGAPVHGPAQRSDHVDARLRAHVRLADGALLSELAKIN